MAQKVINASNSLSLQKVIVRKDSLLVNPNTTFSNQNMMREANFAEIAETVEGIADLADNISSFFSNAKDLVKNYKNDKAFFNSVSTLSSILAIFEKSSIGGIVLGAMGNAANLGTATLNARNEYIETGTFSQESRDAVVEATIDTTGTLFKAISLLFPSAIAKVLVLFPFVGIADLTTAYQNAA